MLQSWHFTWLSTLRYVPSIEILQSSTKSLCFELFDNYILPWLQFSWRSHWHSMQNTMQPYEHQKYNTTDIIITVTAVYNSQDFFSLERILRTWVGIKSPLSHLIQCDDSTNWAIWNPWEQVGGKEGIQMLALGAHYIRRNFLLWNTPAVMILLYRRNLYTFLPHLAPSSAHVSIVCWLICIAVLNFETIMIILLIFWL